MGDADSSGEVPRDQLETALEYLEVSHGMYLKIEDAKKAHAYYDAIDIVQAAMNDELKPPEEVHNLDHTKADIERSRRAREEGYEAATLWDQQYTRSYDEPRGLFSEVMTRVRGLF